MSNIIKLATSFFIATLLSVVASAAQAAIGNWYSSQEECREIAEGGRGVVAYHPAPNSARVERAISAGATRGPLESDICVEMKTISGNYNSVFLPRGTEMLWKDGRLYGHAACGNPVQGEILEVRVAAPQGSVGPQGPQGERGLQGRRGEQGIPGRDGRDGVTQVVHVPMPLEGGMTSGYSGMELARDLGNDLIWGTVFDRATGKFVKGWVRREEIQAEAQILSEYWRAQRGPESLTVQQIGDCNAAFGSTTNCPTTVTSTTNHYGNKPTPTTPTPGCGPGTVMGNRGCVPVVVPGCPRGRNCTPVVVDPGPGVDPPIIRDPGPGVDPPIFRGGNVGVGTPVIGQGPEPGVGPGVGTEPSVGHPIFGDNGLPSPGNNQPPGTGEPGN